MSGAASGRRQAGSPGRRHSTAFLLRAGLLACLVLCTAGAPRRSLLAGDWLNDLPGARTMTINDTPLSSFRNVVNVRVSVRSFLDVGEQRPLKFFFLNAVINRSPEVESYILDTVMPAANSIIARSIRVRSPSGLLSFDGVLDRDGEPIPAPESLGESAEGFDADVVVQVKTAPTEDCAFTARAGVLEIEEATNRPVLGDVEFCFVDPNDFQFDVTTAVHELLHILGVAASLFPFYAGYPDGFPSSTGTNGRLVISSPQVLLTVREFFGCSDLVGAEFEDDGPLGSRNTHWEERIFEGVIIDTARTARSLQTHYNQHVLTDLTLSLLQDSNWYDVKYGSAGFNGYGYQGGCAFATGQFATALADPEASRFLCPERGLVACHHDFSGVGVCGTVNRLDGFFRVQETRTTPDCQGVTRGERCVEIAGGDDAMCAPMSCADDGSVMINGAPCDPTLFNCPDSNTLCGDPGVLTCAATLNDCSGNGDCFNGGCYCHPGWGGDDCSTQVCIDGCSAGSSSCPSSGFCGVSPCGSFSRGSFDRGMPCNRGASSSTTGTNGDTITVTNTEEITFNSSASGSASVTTPDETTSITTSTSTPPLTPPTPPPSPPVTTSIPPLPAAPAPIPAPTPPPTPAATPPTIAPAVPPTAVIIAPPPPAAVSSCSGTCIRNSRQCAGGRRFPLARACCDPTFECVKRNDMFSQCRRIGDMLLPTWNGTVLACGDPA